MNLFLPCLLASVVLGVFPASTTEVDKDERIDRVKIVTKRTKSKYTKPTVIRRPAEEPDIVVTADPNRDQVRCLRYSDGRLTDCEVIVFRDSVAGELREQVRIATRSIGIPGLRVQTRPQSEVLINIDTVLFAEAATFERTVTLLGQDVTVRAVPAAFVWHHGDGTTQTTRSPGKPNAKSDVKHMYRKPAEGLRLTVDTTWTIQYRVAGGSWQDLDETLTVTGPATTLATREARPYLVAR